MSNVLNTPLYVKVRSFDAEGDPTDVVVTVVAFDGATLYGYVAGETGLTSYFQNLKPASSKAATPYRVSPVFETKANATAYTFA